MTPETSSREMVLRALAASEIADSSTSADLRGQFEALAAHWLEAASEAAAETAEETSERQRVSDGPPDFGSDPS